MAGWQHRVRALKLMQITGEIKQRTACLVNNSISQQKDCIPKEHYGVIELVQWWLKKHCQAEAEIHFSSSGGNICSLELILKVFFYLFPRFFSNNIKTISFIQINTSMSIQIQSNNFNCSEGKCCAVLNWYEIVAEK